MSVKYSPVCDTSEIAYLSYLAALLLASNHGTSNERFGEQHGVSCARCDSCGNIDGVSTFLVNAVRGIEGRVRAVDSFGINTTAANIEDFVGCSVNRDNKDCAPVSGISGCDIGSDIGVDNSGNIDGVREVSGACADDTEIDVRTVGEQKKEVGKWWKKNYKARMRRKRKNSQIGRCETVSQSSCPSYGQALSDAEREARESLAKRRAAENALQEKLAKMKLASLEDEQMCKEYADLKRQRIIQWTNEATAKSQQSLEKCKSIDPGSSSSQYEIRQQAKRLADLERDYEALLSKVRAEVCDAEEFIQGAKIAGTDTMESLEEQALFLHSVGAPPEGFPDSFTRW